MDPLIASDISMDADYDEKQDVAIISTDDIEVDNIEPELRADDHEAMKARYLPHMPGTETDSEAVGTWDIHNYRNLEDKEHGPVFECGGHPWRLLFFPFGNNSEFCSLYLEHGYEDKPPENWHACVQFAIVMWNPNDPTIFQSHGAHHRFQADESDWGFTRFCEQRLLKAPWQGKDRPLLENESCKISAFVRVIKDPTGVLWHNFHNYDSRKETGMVGLRNQGATCYLNSLIQSLYFTNAFRKAVYQIPTEQEVDYRANSAYALQRLFHQLQTSPAAVSTQELTAAFGWESRQVFEQQDVQELSRVLMERLEEKMKGTDAENALAKMFAGKMKTYISCINVDYESSRIEEFWDVQLNVSGNKNLDDSFRDYIQVEILDGENKYFAEGYGLQEAKKGVIFESFPNVLHLQLKRFEYDINRDAMMKVNDRYEFPEIWDASPYLSENADRSEPYIYHLHGVLVHSGDLNAGHYYAFLKPTKNGEFYRFDDDRVTRATKWEALEDNFGGDLPPQMNGQIGPQRNPYTRTFSTKKSNSAYMLVYLRESRLDAILQGLNDTAIPSHIERKLAEERALREKKRREAEEAHLFMTVTVATNDNFRAWQGADLVCWDGLPEDPEVPKTYRLRRTTTIAGLCEEVAADLKVDVDLLRPWVMVNRQNKTIRPDAPITLQTMSIEDAWAKFGTRQTQPFRVWMEVTERDDRGQPIWKDNPAQLNGQTSTKPIILFLKHFDVLAQTLKGTTHVYMGRQERVSDLAGPILEIMGWPTGTPLKLFEEIKATMIEPMKPKTTLAQSELQDGDIVCFQRSLTDKENATILQTGGYIEAKDFYEYLQNRIMISFADRLNMLAPDNRFDLILSRRMSYDQFSAKVGEYLKVDPSHLRFFTVNARDGKPKATVKRNPNQTLQQILMPQYTAYGNNNQSPDQMYYEILEMSLSELETKKTIKITWLTDGLTKEETFELLVPRNGVVADILPPLQKKANLDDDTISKVRIYEANSNKVYKELEGNVSVAALNEFVTLYAEKIPEEELNAEESDRIVYAFHFDKEPTKTHSVPFGFLMKRDEAFRETKERLSRRTGIKGKNFERIKFAVVRRISYARPKYLADEDILYDECSDSDQLGLDHINKSRNIWNKADAMQIR